MKLTGELKKNVEAANTPEEARAVLEKAGIVMTDEEMEAISGGDKATLASGNTETFWKNFISLTAGNDPFDPDPGHDTIFGDNSRHLVR